MQIEVSAKTVAEAIAKAEAQLGVNREEMHILVLSEGKTGLFGLGSEEARIKVSVPEPIFRPAPPTRQETRHEARREEVGEPENVEETASVAQEVLEKLLSLMELAATVNVRRNVPSETPGQASPIVLDITGDDLGILIGRRGETLASLQFVVNLIVGKRLQQHSQVNVDVEGYRQRREQSLKGLAFRMADRAKTMRQPVALEPMPAAERRIIHLTLQDNPYVTTHSVGEGEERKVIISPKASTSSGSGSR